MLFTSVAMIYLSHLSWNWDWIKSILVFGFFGIIDLTFFISNDLKFFEGGYVPLLIGLALFLIMSTWRWGRQATYAAYSRVKTMTIKKLIEIHRAQESFLQRNILLLVQNPIHNMEQNTPALMQMVYDRYGLLANNIFFVQIVHKKVPYLYEDRYDVRVFEKNERGMIASVIIKFGFMEDPNVERVLEGLARHHKIQLESQINNWVFHVSQELLKTNNKANLWWRFKLALFGLLRQISRPGYVYYGLGDEMQLSVQIIPVKI